MEKRWKYWACSMKTAPNLPKSLCWRDGKGESSACRWRNWKGSKSAIAPPRPSPIGITGAGAGIVSNRSISQTFGHLGPRLNAALPDRPAPPWLHCLRHYSRRTRTSQALVPMGNAKSIGNLQTFRQYSAGIVSYFHECVSFIFVAILNKH